jgi:hypothetical protein
MELPTLPKSVRIAGILRRIIPLQIPDRTAIHQKNRQKTKRQKLEKKRKNNAKQKALSKSLGKVPEPEHYTGKDRKPLTLTDWELGTSMYLKAAHLNPDCCRASVNIMNLLEEEAKQWYTRTVLPDVNRVWSAGKDRTISPWSFERIVAALRDRFVSPTAHREAEAAWNALSQNLADGSYMTVHDLSTKLEELGRERLETTQTQ